MTNTKYDLVIVGAGIVGAACAFTLMQQRPKLKVLLIEKESNAANHQTGRNSGVIHAGVYYEPGSLKAKFCRQGLEQTMGFCQQNDIQFQQCGKLLVATDETEVSRMHALYDRCELNDLQPEWLDERQLRGHEPHVVGRAAILVRHTGITSYRNITDTMIRQFQRIGGHVVFNQELQAVERKGGLTQINTASASFSCGQLLNCAGLMSDKIARKCGLTIDSQIIPFRGEYFRLPTKYNQIVSRLIYPIPDPALPFLGVHLTRMIDGSVTVGPNAVLAMAREGYSKTNINLAELSQTLTFGGFWKLLSKYPQSSISEIKNSLSKRGYLKLVQKYCPQIQISDLLPYPSGVRAQAVNSRGELIHDFQFAENDFSLHVINAPSPAATSALPIAEHIVGKLKDRF